MISSKVLPLCMIILSQYKVSSVELAYGDKTQLRSAHPGTQQSRVELHCGRRYDMDQPEGHISVTVLNDGQLLAHAYLTLQHESETKLVLNVTTLKYTVLKERFLSMRNSDNLWEVASDKTVYSLSSPHIKLFWKRNSSSSIFNGIDSWCSMTGSHPTEWASIADRNPESNVATRPSAFVPTSATQADSALAAANERRAYIMSPAALAVVALLPLAVLAAAARLWAAVQGNRRTLKKRF